MNNLLALFAALSLAACSPNEKEVVIISTTLNGLSVKDLEDHSLSIEGDELDLLVVFGDQNKSISIWSNRQRMSAEAEGERWSQFQSEVRGELESRFDVKLRSDLEQKDFVEALKATLELSNFRQHYVTLSQASRVDSDQQPGEGANWKSQDWEQNAAIFNR